MTPEERAARCLERHEDKSLNDSMWLPVDLEARIAAAIRAAVEEEREACILDAERCAQWFRSGNDDNQAIQRSIGAAEVALWIKTRAK